MRCILPQALWPEAPPEHAVTCVLASSGWRSIWTGAADGGILNWRVEGEVLDLNEGPNDGHAQKSLWPVAMLCGHSAAISALAICQPSDGSDSAGTDTRPPRRSSVKQVTFLDTSGRRISAASSNVSRRTSAESADLSDRPSSEKKSFLSDASNRSLEMGALDSGGPSSSPMAAYEEAERLEQRRRSSIESETSGGLGGDDEALLSLCVDGTLCVWDIGTGRCRRRRRLPPWAGVPEASAVLGKERRYVSVACEGASGLGLGGIAPTGASASQRGGSGRGVVLIVDTATLAVVQTVAHGVLGIGPVKSLVAALDYETAACHTLVAADARGGVQVWWGIAGGAGRKEPQAKSPKADAGKQKAESKQEDGDLTGGGDSQPGVSAAVSPDGRLVAVVGQNFWEVRLVEGAKVLARETRDGGSAWQGALFLRQGESSASADRLLLWDEAGGAVVYDISSLQVGLLSTDSHPDSAPNGKELNPASLSAVASIPQATTEDDVSSCRFCQVAGRVVARVTVGPTVVEGGWGANPSVTLWKLPPLSSGALEKQGSQPPAAELVEEARLADGWAYSEPGGLLREGSSLLVGKSDPSSEPVQAPEKDAGTFEQASTPPVTSSLLIGGGAFSPTCLVRGYADGLIRIFSLVASPPGTLQGGRESNQGVLSLEGHGAAVLCLAEQKAPPSLNVGHGRVLLSGSLDWTVRAWDVSRAGAALAVFRQHVGPVRALLLPPAGTPSPWASSFCTVSDDATVALSSLETLRCERIFPGHVAPPRACVWDGKRGYLACLCCPDSSGTHDVLYIWDLHSGSRDRHLRGSAAHSLFSFLGTRVRAGSGISVTTIGANSGAGSAMGGNTTAALAIPTAEVIAVSPPGGSAPPAVSSGASGAAQGSTGTGLTSLGSASNLTALFTGGGKDDAPGLKTAFSNLVSKAGDRGGGGDVSGGPKPRVKEGANVADVRTPQQPIRGTCPLPGVAALQYDLMMLMAPELAGISSDLGTPGPSPKPSDGAKPQTPGKGGLSAALAEQKATDENKLWSVEGSALRMSLAFLHLWGVSPDLDQQLKDVLGVTPPGEDLRIGPGLMGDKGAMTLLFPAPRSRHEFWRASPEFSAVRALTMVALAQRLMLLSKNARGACSMLAAQYSRGLVEKLRGMAPPSLEVFACFWQDSCEHLRQAARSLFHNAALRALPDLLRGPPSRPGTPREDFPGKGEWGVERWEGTRADVVGWLESEDGHDWASVIGGSRQDAKAARVVVAAALSVWYPSLVRPDLPAIVAPYLLQLLTSADVGAGRHSATAAEVLAEGMVATWQPLLGSLNQLVSQVLGMTERLSGAKAKSETPKTPSGEGGISPAVAMVVRESLASNLLPALAAADLPGFLQVVRHQCDTVSPESPAHLTALMALIRAVRANSRVLVPHLSQLVAVVVHVIDPALPALRKVCLQTAMAVLLELVRIYPMVAYHQESMRLAVGDPIGDANALKIDVYDLQNAFKMRVLDASGGPATHNGVNATLSHVLSKAEGAAATTYGSIAAVCFSSDGEGVVAYSRPNSALRWWNLGAAWWANMRRTSTLVQCSKMVVLPPLPGLGSSGLEPKLGARTGEMSRSRRTSIEYLSAVTQGLDLSLRLEPKQDRTVTLYRNNAEIGTFTI